MNSLRPLKVFLCHAHPDAEKIRALYARLKADGVDAWLDKENIIPGQDWEFEIRKAVRESDIVVVCLSKQFSQKGYRQNEVRIALEEASLQPEGEIFIIPARLEECNYLESLKRFHGVDLFEERGYEYLMRALRLQADKIGAVLQSKKGWLGGLTSPTKKPDTQKPKPVVKPQPTPQPEEPKPVITQKPPRKWNTRMIVAIAGIVIIFAAIFGLPWKQWFATAPDTATVTPTNTAAFTSPSQTLAFTPAVPTKTTTPVFTLTSAPTQITATPTPKTLKWSDVTVSLPQRPIVLENANQIELLTTLPSPYNTDNFVLSSTDDYVAFTVGVNVYTVGFLDGNLRHIFEGHTNNIGCLALSPDGHFLATAASVANAQDYKGEIRIWDVESGSLIKILESVSQSQCELVFSPDSMILAHSTLTDCCGRVGSVSEANTVQLWRTSDWARLQAVNDPKSDLFGIDISPDSNLLGIGTADNLVLLWNIKETKIVKAFKEGDSNFEAVKFSNDGKLLISVNSKDKIWVWNIEDGSLVSSFQSFGCGDLSILDNKLLVCKSYGGKVYFWDITKGQLVSNLDLFPISGHADYEISITHNKTLLVGFLPYSSYWDYANARRVTVKSKISLWGIP